MFKEFFDAAAKLPTHHQAFLSFIVFFGVSAIWWAGYVYFDEFFLVDIKQRYRVLLAFAVGLAVLVFTHHAVTNLMG